MATYHETSPLLPEGEQLRRAVKWVAEEGLSWNLETVNEVSNRYDLSPLEEEFLLREFVQHRGIGG